METMNPAKLAGSVSCIRRVRNHRAIQRSIVQGAVDFIKALGVTRLAAMGAVTAALIGFFAFVILRVIDSLQLTANYSVATPANWKHGEDVIIVAAVKDEDVPAKFPKGHKRIKPYLRTTPQPNL